MFDQLVQWLLDYPYLGAAGVFLLCGLGLPLPEEIVLLAAGYVCAKLPDNLDLGLMMVWCAGAILAGDLLPYVLGRVFGTRLLRVRWMRILVTKRRLAMFDRWFRRRGDLVILIARFVAGLRVVAFFTAGAMKMPWRRFLVLDGLGILLIVPLLTWLGYHSQGFIDEMIENVQRVERGILWAVAGGAGALAIGLWAWRRGKRRKARRTVGEAFVQPSRPVQPPEDAEPAESDATDTGPTTQTPNTPTSPEVRIPPPPTDNPIVENEPRRDDPKH